MALKKGKKKGSSLEMPDKVKAQMENLERMGKGKPSASSVAAKVEGVSTANTAEPPTERSVSERRREIGRRNKQRGTATEREVAKRTGGERVVGSGAYKHSSHNLLGDVQVMDEGTSNPIITIEVKTTERISPKGERSFTLKKSVLDQIREEAAVSSSIDALYIHWLGMSFQDSDYVILSSDSWFELVRLAKLGKRLEKLIDKGIVDG